MLASEQAGASQYPPNRPRMSTRPVANPELLAFVRAAKEHGVNDEFIVSLLGDRGWSERRVYAARSADYVDPRGMPVTAR